MLKRFEGSFVNQKGQTWKVEIWQEGGGDVFITDDASAAYLTDENGTPLVTGEQFVTMGELTFDADAPLEIEWDEREKYEPLCGSTLTLNVISPGDRTFADLFQIAPNNVMAKVYLDEQLFWQGNLDCETYEEPYQYAKDYTVTLTFTDFGPLQRVKYAEGAGLKRLIDIISYCLNQIGWSELPIETSYSLYKNDAEYSSINTHFTACSLGDIHVDSANFYDEDGEASTLDEVLEGVLQPLGLRIVQRAGRIVVYDLHTLYQKPPVTEAIAWDGDEQTMGVDKLAQTAKVKFSPYGAESIIASDEVSLNAFTDGTFPHIDQSLAYGALRAFDFYNTKSESALKKGSITKHNDAEYFRMQKIFSGNDCEGIAWRAITNERPMSELMANPSDMAGVIDSGFSFMRDEPEVLLRMPRKWCSASTYYSASEDYKYSAHYLWLKQELMLDSRYNPFDEAKDSHNEKENTDWCKVRQAIVYLPFTLFLLDADGVPTYYYHKDMAARTSDIDSTKRWVKVEASTNMKDLRQVGCFMAYYDNSWTKKSGVQGWCTNRDEECFARYSEVLDDDFVKNVFPTSGERIPLPPQAGYLELTLYTGLVMFDESDGATWYHYPRMEQIYMSYDDTKNSRQHAFGCYNRNMQLIQRWWLYQFPTLELVKGIHMGSAKVDDVEYSAWVNPKAKDEISLSTICGTDPTGKNASAMGLFRKSNGRALELRRTNTQKPWRIEYDLMGMLFCQYGDRHVTLEGECITPKSPLTLFTEPSQNANARFMMKSEVLQAIEGTSQIKFVELTDEVWTKNIIKQ